MTRGWRTDSQPAEAAVSEEGRDVGLFCGKEHGKPHTPSRSSKPRTSTTWTLLCVRVQGEGVCRTVVWMVASKNICVSYSKSWTLSDPGKSWDLQQSISQPGGTVRALLPKTRSRSLRSWHEIEQICTNKNYMMAYYDNDWTATHIHLCIGCSIMKIVNDFHKTSWGGYCVGCGGAGEEVSVDGLSRIWRGLREGGTLGVCGHS